MLWWHVIFKQLFMNTIIAKSKEPCTAAVPQRVRMEFWLVLRVNLICLPINFSTETLRSRSERSWPGRICGKLIPQLLFCFLKLLSIYKIWAEDDFGFLQTCFSHWSWLMVSSGWVLCRAPGDLWLQDSQKTCEVRGPVLVYHPCLQPLLTVTGSCSPLTDEPPLVAGGGWGGGRVPARRRQPSPLQHCSPHLR